jgi:hypothetical protein
MRDDEAILSRTPQATRPRALVNRQRGEKAFNRRVAVTQRDSPHAHLVGGRIACGRQFVE